MTTPSTGTRVARLIGVALAICITTLGVTSRPADGAGHRSGRSRGVGDATINATGVAYLGGYRLAGVSRANAFSVGPGVGAAEGTYTAAKPTVDSSRLDALLFMLETGLIANSDDRAIAAAGLVWWYADTRRPDGSAVWSDPKAAFAPISPRSPHDWSQLPPYSKKVPIGIKGQGVDFDVAERELAALDVTAEQFAGPWTLRLVGSDTVRLEANGRPLPGVPVFYTPPQTTPPSDVEPAPALVKTDGNGEIDVTEIRALWDEWAAEHAERRAPADGRLPVPDGSVRFVPDMVWVDAPGRHAEWVSDGGGARLATATIERLGQELVLDDRFPATTTTTTTTSSTTTTSTPASSTTTIASSTTTIPNATTSTAAVATTTTTTSPGSTTGSTTTAAPNQSTTIPEVAPPGPTGPGGSSGSGPASNIPVPVTGPSRVLGWILRFGDVIILVGVALVVGAEYLPQRKETTAP